MEKTENERARTRTRTEEERSFLERLTEPGVCDVRDRLLAHGASLRMASDVVRAVLRRGAQGAWAIDAAAAVLGRSFRVPPSPKVRRGADRPCLFAFVGPTGGGKTTTLAKLGRRLEERGRRVLFASLDGGGAGALALEADLDRTELPLAAVRDVRDLAARWRAAGEPEVVLVDTPPFSPRESEELDVLARGLERMRALGPMETLLVLPATMSRASAALARRAFERTAPTSCVLTKLDETDEPLALLEDLGRARVAVSFLCDGVDTRACLARATPARFADLALRGRYA